MSGRQVEASRCTAHAHGGGRFATPIPEDPPTLCASRPSILPIALDVEYTDTFGSWWDELTEEKQERVTAAVELLEQSGPTLGRPLVDPLKGSRHPNMKELRPHGGHMRVLFAFDPRRNGDPA
ncbi:MAG: type II toxin-antitoxin system RelE/ParE family toxin [Solirubrobacteraceae bacterium]